MVINMRRHLDTFDKIRPATTPQPTNSYRQRILLEILLELLPSLRPRLGFVTLRLVPIDSSFDGLHECWWLGTHIIGDPGDIEGLADGRITEDKRL